MTIQAEIISALEGVANNNVFPDAAPERVLAPLVIMRRSAYDPLNVLTGSTGVARSTFLFMCWGAKTTDPPELKKGAKKVALETAAAVRLAINGNDSSGSPFDTFFEEAVNGDDFEPETLEVMEPVSFSFWHAV